MARKKRPKPRQEPAPLPPNPWWKTFEQIITGLKGLAISDPKLFHQSVTLPFLADTSFLTDRCNLKNFRTDEGWWDISHYWPDYLGLKPPWSPAAVDCRRLPDREGRRQWGFDCYYGEGSPNEVNSALAHWREQAAIIGHALLELPAELAATIPTDGLQRSSSRWVNYLYALAKTQPTALVRIGFETYERGVIWAKYRKAPKDPSTRKGIGPTDRLALSSDLVTSSIEVLQRLLARAKDINEPPLSGKATSIRTRIPPTERTRPMTLSAAAQLMGYGRARNKKQAVKVLRAAIDGGEIRCEKFTRQQYVFDRSQFPEESHSKLTPTDPKSP